MNHHPVRKPKVPLSAYNLFFQVERKRILNGTDHLGLLISHEELVVVAAEYKARDGRRPHRRTHGRIGFKELARIVAHRWKALDRATKKILEQHARLQKREHRELLEAYMTTEEYQLELQAKQLEANLDANPYYPQQEEVSAAKLHQEEDVKLFPDFHFQKTAALVQEVHQVSKEFDSKPQGHVLRLPSEETKKQAHSCCSGHTSIQNSEEERGTTELDEYYSVPNETDPRYELVPCSAAVNNVQKQCDDAVFPHEKEGLEAGIPEHKTLLLSSESDRLMMVYMVAFHLSRFPKTSCMSDLFGTSALNETHQDAEELFEM